MASQQADHQKEHQAAAPAVAAVAAAASHQTSRAAVVAAAEGATTEAMRATVGRMSGKEATGTGKMETGSQHNLLLRLQWVAADRQQSATSPAAQAVVGMNLTCRAASCLISEAHLRWVCSAAMNRDAYRVGSWLDRARVYLVALCMMRGPPTMGGAHVMVVSVCTLLCNCLHWYHEPSYHGTGKEGTTYCTAIKGYCSLCWSKVQKNT